MQDGALFGGRREAPAKDAEFVVATVAVHQRPGRGGRTGDPETVGYIDCWTQSSSHLKKPKFNLLPADIN